MPRNFDTEVREAFNKKFLKVFIKDLDRISEIKSLLDELNSNRKVNITKSGSKNNPLLTLTIYPSRVYSIDELQTEINVTLKSYFDGNQVDPVFVEEGLSSISHNAYNQIIDYINKLGKNFEKFNNLKRELNEEQIRDYFLPFLNTISKKHSATGETFNKMGKTDILIQNEDGENVFIAECKIWRGQTQLTDAINQLLDGYVSWRDEKIALIVFNKNVQKFSDLITKAFETMKIHPNFSSYQSARNSTSFSFIFQHPEDNNRNINIELILFNFM